MKTPKSNCGEFTIINQTPSECKYFGCCIDRGGIIDVETNTWSCDCQNDCSDYEPKEKKDGE